MSDGPYRALPMSRAWKRLAAAIENQNFEPLALRARLRSALLDDWHDDGGAVAGALRKTFRSREGMLFPNADTSDIEALRRVAAPCGVVSLLLDCAAQALAAGKTGEGALIEATKTAFALRCSQGFLQVEEHYLRNAPRAATNVRGRLATATDDGDLTAMARTALGLDPRARLRVLRATGLDDGVPI